jgi:transcription elongation factor SPT6
MGFLEAERYLSSKPIGEVVFRPSSKPDHLSITWKLAEATYIHIEVGEYNKESEFAIGSTLKIGKRTFADIDEIAALYIEPMTKLAIEIMNSPKYLSIPKVEISQQFSRELMANPRRIPYALCKDDEKMGFFKLVCLFSINDQLNEETITLDPEGYKYRDVIHSSVNDLINFFKSSQSKKMSGKEGPVGGSHNGPSNLSRTPQASSYKSNQMNYNNNSNRKSFPGNYQGRNNNYRR